MPASKLLPFLFLLLPSLGFSQRTDEDVLARLDSIWLWVDDHYELSRKTEVVDKLNEALSLASSQFGTAHAKYLYCLRRVGWAYLDLQELKTGLHYLKKAEKEAAKQIERDSAFYFSTLMDLAHGYSEGDMYEEALTLLLKALSFFEKHPAEFPEKLSESYTAIGWIYLDINDFQHAKEYIEKAMHAIEKYMGRDNKAYARALEELAGYYIYQYDYLRAEPLLEKAMDLNIRLRGKESDPYASNCNNMAIICLDLGRYEEAEKYFREAIRIDLLVSDGERVGMADNYHNLAVFYETIGNYDAAVEYSAKALRIFKEYMGENSVTYGSTLVSHSANLAEVGRTQEALDGVLRGMQIIEKGTGKNNTFYRDALSQLASIYQSMGQHGKAISAHRESNRISKHLFGEDHLDYAISLGELGNLYMDQKEYQKAMPLIEKSVAIQKREVGEETLHYIFDLFSLGECQFRMGNLPLAAENMAQAGRLGRQFLSGAATYLSEKELRASTGQFLDLVATELAFSWKNREMASLLAAELFNNLLFYKGFLLSAATSLRQDAVRNPECADIFHELQRVQQNLAFQNTLPVEERNSIDGLLRSRDSLEKQLVLLVSSFSESRKIIQWEDVKGKLGKDEAVVEFFHFEDIDNKDQTFYGAMVLRADSEIPEMIPLFDASVLKKLIGNSAQKRSDFVNHLYQWEERGASEMAEKLPSLAELIWEPILPYLKDIRTLHCAESGLLHLFNLAAIPLNEMETILDRFDLRQYRSTRSLAIPEEQAVKKESLLFGGVYYEIDSFFLASRNLELRHWASQKKVSGEPSGNLLASRGGSWNFLKWTEREVEAISSILENAGYEQTVFSGPFGSEDEFKHFSTTDKSPGLMHLATHGYFFPDPKNESNTSNGKRPIFESSEDPMVRSGLIMAGGNHFWQGKQAIEGIEDGVLTALEISQTDLSQTQLVVLSACETGLGDIDGNEGVYGLQRAFKIAGARFLIMSLWQIPDRETKDFMVAFYRHWMEEGLPVREAFRVTQLEMKERFYNPYQWAGFVLIE